MQGEKIKAPSDEVLELQTKNPTATYLVRFFDGRRTWYVGLEKERKRERKGQPVLGAVQPARLFILLLAD